MLTVILTLALAGLAGAQSSAASSTASATQSAGNCHYSGSLTDYLSCEKSSMSTTTLVSAGIGVTVAIFAVIFGIVWLSKRSSRKKAATSRSAPSSPVGPSRPTRSAPKNEEAGSAEDRGPREKERRSSTDKKALQATVEDEDSQEEYEESAPQYSPPRRPQARPLQAPPPGHHRRPDLQRAAPSDEGSPVEPVPSRELYPSNPSPKPRHLQESRRGAAANSRQPSVQQSQSEKIPPIPPFRAERQGSTTEIHPSQPPRSQRTRLTSASSVSSASSGASASSASIPPIPPFNPQRHATRLAEAQAQPTPVTVPTKPAPTPSGGRPPIATASSQSSRQSRMAPTPSRPEGGSRSTQGATRPLDIRKSVARPSNAPPLLVPERGGGTRRSVLPSYYERPVSSMSTTTGRVSVRQSSMLQDAPPLPAPSIRPNANAPGDVIGPKSDFEKGRTAPRPEREQGQDDGDMKEEVRKGGGEADNKSVKATTGPVKDSLAPPTSTSEPKKGTNASPAPSPGAYDGLAPPSANPKPTKGSRSASRSPNPSPPKKPRSPSPEEDEISPKTTAATKKKDTTNTSPSPSDAVAVIEAVEQRSIKSPAGKKRLARPPDPPVDESSASDSDNPAPPKKPVRRRKPGQEGKSSDQDRERRPAVAKERSTNGSRKEGMI